MINFKGVAPAPSPVSAPIPTQLKNFDEQPEAPQAEALKLRAQPTADTVEFGDR